MQEGKQLSWLHCLEVVTKVLKMTLKNEISNSIILKDWFDPKKKNITNSLQYSNFGKYMFLGNFRKWEKKKFGCL